MVRNPIHRATSEYSSSAEEIDGIVKNGADIIMLPYFKSATEVKTFIDLVGGRARTLPLVETPEAVESIEEILGLLGVDEIYIGLNDLSLGYHKKFMFELLADGTVEKLCFKFRQKGILYGFGGIASVGKGLLPAEKVIREHYRLGSTSVILSRSFCDVNKINHMVSVTLGVSVLTDTAYLIYSKTALKVRFRFGHFEKGLFKSLFAYTSFIAINLIVDQVNGNLGKFILGRFQGTTVVAIYAVGYSLYQCTSARF